MGTLTNRLAGESSPYLLQHAHNPVDWYPWGEEAFEKAKKENKPMLVSIGYAACHWCHVMERESFEDESTARIMNENFVNIKIDREERPDLDHIYMDAIQAISGSGGWPLNVFLTPEAKPFYGGTYFPPQRAFNRPSWQEVLLSVAQAFKERRDEIDSQAENLTRHIYQSNQFGEQKITNTADRDRLFNKVQLQEIFENIMKTADKVAGGFGRAPKFPQTFTIQFLLHFYYYTKNNDALQQACLSLDKMVYGGIFDQLAGGFARYATDNDWLIPHFEKMLYDNALLVMVLCEAYQITQKPIYKDAIHQTLSFVEKDFLSPEGGFYSAYDADSEGEEGKYYVWDKEEIEGLLGDDAPVFCDFYDVTENGNFEHKNILHVKLPLKEFAQRYYMDEKELAKKLDAGKKILLEYRLGRIPPLLDDKILLGWNALMNLAYSKAFATLGDDKYRDISRRNMEFIWKNLKSNNNTFHHTFKKKEAKFPAFLDDYAYLIHALLSLQEITGEPSYLERAKSLLEFVLENFNDIDGGMLFYTHKDQTDVIVRKKEVFDGATPSANSVMVWNLYYLGVVFDKSYWVDEAIKLCSFIQPVVQRYPTSFGYWATVIQGITYGIPEISILGKVIEDVRKEFLRTFIPLKIFQSSTLENKSFPLLYEKPVSEEPKIFLCKNYSCQNPVTEVSALMRLLEKV